MKKILALSLVLVMIFSLMPFSALAEGTAGTAYITVENTTYSTGDGANWDGTLINSYAVDIETGDTMMDALLAALDANEISYELESGSAIVTIGELGKGYGGGQFLGTLNGLLFEQSFSETSINNDDEIKVMYTANLGEDVGFSLYDEFSIQDIEVTVDGSTTATTIEENETYTVNVDVGSGSYAITPTITLYEVRDGEDDIVDETKTSGELDANASGTTSFSWTPFESGSCSLKAFITAETDGLTTCTKFSTLSVTVEEAANTAPSIKDGVSSTASESFTLGEAYSLTLTDIFEDADDDTLSYTVKIGDEEAAAASTDYSITPDTSGEYTLVFTANDGTEDSTTYTVTLTVEEASSTNPEITVLPTGSAANVTSFADLEKTDNCGMNTYRVVVPAGTTEIKFTAPDSCPIYGLNNYSWSIENYYDDAQPTELTLALGEDYLLSSSDISTLSSFVGTLDSTQTTYYYGFVDYNFEYQNSFIIILEESSGEETGDYYEISDADDLVWFAGLVNGTLTDGTEQDASANAILTEDIDLSSVCGATLGEGDTAISWTPIGTSDTSYTGDFNGNGKAIENLYIDASTQYQGLFGYNSGTIKNLTIANGTINSSAYYAGAFAGYNTGLILCCLNQTTDVTSGDRYAGGIAGCSTGTVANCVNTGTLSCSVRNSYISGIAYNSGGYVVNCYNTGSVSGNRYVAGISVSTLGTVNNCYNTGTITASTYGAITRVTLGSNVSCSNCYYLETSCDSDSYATAMSATDMKAEAFATTLGASFAYDSNTTNDGYPILSWQSAGAYPEPESTDGLTVTSVDSVSNGSVTVIVSKALEYTALSSYDFSGTVQIGSNASETISFTGITQDGTTVTLTYTELSKGTTDQTVNISVGYKDTEAKTTSFTLSASSYWVDYATEPNAVSSGEFAGCYEITSAEELAWFAGLVNGTLDGVTQDTDANAYLTGDIYLNDTSDWTSWDETTEDLKYWTPIGSYDADSASVVGYNGTFDGCGYAVYGIFTDGNDAAAGLFGRVVNGVVSNVGVCDSFIYQVETTIGCSTSGYIYAGGITGLVYGSDCRISNCYNTATVKGYASSNTTVTVGGIAGGMRNATIENCYNAGLIMGAGRGTSYPAYVGGIAGNTANNCTVTNCYNAGVLEGLHVHNYSAVYGICYSALVTNCYNTGTLSVLYTDKVSSDKNVIVMTSGNYGDINCYYLEGGAASTSSSYVDSTRCLAVEKTETEFTDGTVAELLGDAYTTVEGVNNDYPVLAVFGADTQYTQIPGLQDGVDAVAQLIVDTSASSEFAIDLADIFTGENLTYKVSVDGGDYTEMASAVYSGTLSGDETVLTFTASSGYIDGDTYIVTVSKKDAETARSQLLDVYFAAAALSADDYYTSDDRYNGTTVYDGDYDGFWSDLQGVLNNTAALLADTMTDEQCQTYKEAIAAAAAELIPDAQANATLLYEKIQKVATYDEDLYTAYTWVVLTEAVEDGEAMLASLYNSDASATALNTADYQDEVDAAAEAIYDALFGIFNAENYEDYYDTYNERIDEAKALISLYDPDDMTGADYTSESWEAFNSAYEQLEYDAEYTVVGGTTEDKNVLGYFEIHMDAFISSILELTSTSDITVSLTYINNYAADSSDTDGTGIYANNALSLSSGSTTVYNAVDAAGITFADDGALIAVYVNGICLTNLCAPDELDNYDVQLHQGDEVVVVQVSQIRYEVEASSGYDSTDIFKYRITSSSDMALYNDSYALTDVTVEDDNITVGDKVTIGAAVAGAYTTNYGDELSAENMTLFVSDVSAVETLAAPVNETIATTNSDGELEYIFRESGWYTIAMFNLSDDDRTFTSVYNVTTYGIYYSLYTGGYALVYVEASDDIDAVLDDYRAEKTAEAKAYYDSFSDYDFEEGYYESAFTAQYETLISNLESAQTLKELLDQYDLDFEQLQEYGETAYDHDALISELREYLAYLPTDLTEMDYTYSKILGSIKTLYTGFNNYQINLLSTVEVALLDEILIIIEHGSWNVYPTQVNITISTENYTIANSAGYLLTAPNHNIVYTVYPDGTASQTYYEWTTTGSSDLEPSTYGMTAYDGNKIVLRRLIEQSDDSYWLAYSVDSGVTWTLFEFDGTDTVHDNYKLFSAEFILELTDNFEGDTQDIQVKGLSKTAYDAIINKDIDDAKEAAVAVLQDTYAGYDLSKYDDTGKQALSDALSEGIADINAATTIDDVTEARKAAIAAMGAVKKASSSSGSESEESTYDSGTTVGQVYVTIENTTYDDAAFTGTIVEGWYDLGENDSMMTVILKALEMDGYTWNTGSSTVAGNVGLDYGIVYLAGIFKGDGELSQFDGGQKSGWMGTLNDWFTNEGFAAFTYDNGGIESGDEICVMYTCDYGEDIGGTWYNSDTSLDDLSITGGTLMPSFDGDTTSYIFVITSERASVKVTPTAVNKNYQVKTFLNNYKMDSAFYKRTELISVTSGDILYIGVGEEDWKTMNSSSDPTKYTVKVYTIEDAIDSLVSANVITLANHTKYAETAELLRALVNSASYSGDVTKLEAVEEKVTFYAEIQNVKDLLEAIPDSDNVTLSDKSAVVKAASAYEALTEEQQAYITVSDVENYNAAIEVLTELGAFKTGAVPSTIEGSDEEPDEEVSSIIELDASVSNGEAKASVTAGDIADIVGAADDDGTTSITIIATTDETVTKSTVTLPSGSTSDMADAGMSLTVETSNGTFDIDNSALSAIGGTGSGEIEMIVEQLDEDGLSDTIKELVGDHPVFDLSITVGGTKVTEFGNGTVTVSLPYVPADGEDTDKLTVYYIDDDGSAAEMEGAYYDASTGCVVFETNHFSTFAIVFDDSISFDDVDEDDWFYEAVMYAAENGLFSGTGDDAFSPNADMTRAMLVTVLYRLEGEPEITGSNAFDDVIDGQWYTNAVVWAGKNGLISGYGSGLFGTNDSVTREQMATILYNYAVHKGYDVTEAADLAAFDDVGDISSWASAAMSWANGEGLITGVTDTALDPSGSATRAQVATLLMRFVESIVD